MKEGAINAIMEKERIILELKEQVLEESDNNSFNIKMDAFSREKEEWE